MINNHCILLCSFYNIVGAFIYDWRLYCVPFYNVVGAFIYDRRLYCVLLKTAKVPFTNASFSVWTCCVPFGATCVPYCNTSELC